MHQEVASTDVNMLSARLQTLHTDVSDIKGTLKDLTSAINKLALVEERISNAAAAQERTFKVIERMEERIEALEKAQMLDDRNSAWIGKGVWAILAAFITYAVERMRNG